MDRDTTSRMEKKFERLFDDHFTDVSLFLKMYASSRAELQDWVQDIFADLWEKRDRIDIDQPAIRSYLLKAARHHALKKLRSKRTYDAWCKEYMILLSDLHHSTDIPEPLLPDYSQLYQRALSELPRRAMETWKLSREEGLTYHEIAETMGVSVKTVETQISKSLRFLRKKIDEPY